MRLRAQDLGEPLLSQHSQRTLPEAQLEICFSSEWRYGEIHLSQCHEQITADKNKRTFTVLLVVLDLLCLWIKRSIFVVIPCITVNVIVLLFT